jgi:hypothetical protein
MKFKYSAASTTKCAAQLLLIFTSALNLKISVKPSKVQAIVSPLNLNHALKPINVRQKQCKYKSLQKCSS